MTALQDENSHEIEGKIILDAVSDRKARPGSELGFVFEFEGIDHDLNPTSIQLAFPVPSLALHSQHGELRCARLFPNTQHPSTLHTLKHHTLKPGWAQ